MLKRRILYFICLIAVVFGINIFYVEYQIFILLVLMIAIPLVSWIMYAISDVSHEGLACRSIRMLYRWETGLR